MTRHLASACVALATASLVAAPGPAVRAVGDRAEGFTTWIERRAPGAFIPGSHETLGGLSVAYHMDAEVLLPLWVTSLTLYSRANVGLATAFYRDIRLSDGEKIRTFEFFTTSVPERARGVDRMGFFREALGLTDRGFDWTAYFGTMTTSPEKTFEQAEKASGSGPRVAYEVTDGFSTASETTAGVFDVVVDRRSTNADELYETVRPKLADGQPRYTRLQQGSGARPLPPLAFLGALQVSLRAAAASRLGPKATPVPRVAFVHNGTVRYLAVEGMASDAGRGRTAASQGFAKDPAAVYRLDFRIINPGSDDGQFKLWAELHREAGSGADVVPIPPIAFELTPRAFLRLRFERSK
jgi:hypothetical protein